MVTVPDRLRSWFVVHFVADMLFGMPLFIAPEFTLRLFGWQVVDPFTARIVGAALLGIGGESLLGRNGNLEQFRGMLRLKLIWAASSIAGMTITLLSGDAPPVGWVFVAIFVAFFFLWAWYAYRLRRGADQA